MYSLVLSLPLMEIVWSTKGRQEAKISWRVVLRHLLLYLLLFILYVYVQEEKLTLLHATGIAF